LDEKLDICENQAKGTIKKEEQADISKNSSNNTKNKAKSQEAGGINQQQGTIIPQNLENFIIIHASVQQNYAYQHIHGIWGSAFLDVLIKTIEKSKAENSLDILKLSFDLVENIVKRNDFPFYRKEGEKKVYDGRVKLLCEADVHLHENFCLRMDGGKIDSEA
jgi:hypothetical protein